jgi:hypothetical protein
VIAAFVDENFARFAAAALSGVTHRPISLLKTMVPRIDGWAKREPPLARFLDGAEISPTAIIRPLTDRYGPDTSL